MDVVATRIRGDLKGDVMLRTEPNRGTRVTLFLPLTLTIVNALSGARRRPALCRCPSRIVDSTAKIVQPRHHPRETRAAKAARGWRRRFPSSPWRRCFGGGAPPPRTSTSPRCSATATAGPPPGRRAHRGAGDRHQARRRPAQHREDFLGCLVLENGQARFHT